MTTSLLNTLNGLAKEPTLVLHLYKQVFEATFCALVRSGTEKGLDKMEFLTYNTQDNIRELPLFTSEEFILNNPPQDTLVVQVSGQLLWTKLLDILESGKCEGAINPGQAHGIRLIKEIVLGMIANYGTPDNPD